MSVCLCLRVSPIVAVTVVAVSTVPLKYPRSLPPQVKSFSRGVYACVKLVFICSLWPIFVQTNFEMGFCCCLGCHYYDYSINYDSLIKIRNVLLLLTAFFLKKKLALDFFPLSLLFLLLLLVVFYIIALCVILSISFTACLSIHFVSIIFFCPYLVSIDCYY